MLRESQRALDIDLIEHGIAQFQLRQSKLLAQLVPLTLVRLPVYGPFVQECLVGSKEALPYRDGSTR